MQSSRGSPIRCSRPARSSRCRPRSGSPRWPSSRNEEDVLRQSDVALYAAKRAGRNQFAWFDQQLDRELTERLSLEEDMRTGILKGEFVPFFQPLIDLESRELVGFETLARWRSPKRGLLEAEYFIEVAESTGLIGPLTMSVMEQAMKDARSWPAHLKIAVNISPVQFRDARLAEHIIKLLTETGFPASRLEIEITEASLLEDRAQVVTIIHSLKNLGVSVSLDDFGTGYASLAQVNSLADRPHQDRQDASSRPWSKASRPRRSSQPSPTSATRSTCRSPPRASNPSRSAAH